MKEYANETIKVIEERVSLRNFLPNSITEEEREIITSAAFRAPNGGRMSKYSLIDVRDPIVKKTLAKTCGNQPFIATAPGVYAVMSDFRRWFRLFNMYVKTSGTKLNHPREDEIILCAIDALLAAENMVIAAESLGIGSCFIADMVLNYETHKELFKLPQYVMPITLVVLGKPPGDYEAELTPRINIPLVHEDYYRDPSDEELSVMVEPLLAKDGFGNVTSTVEEYVNHWYLRRLGGALSFERANSVRAIFDDWLKDPYEG